VIVFALFYERPDGSRQFIADADGEIFAKILGTMYSRDCDCPIVAVENSDSGDTAVSCRFLRGRMIERTLKSPVPALSPSAEGAHTASNDKQR